MFTPRSFVRLFLGFVLGLSLIPVSALAEYPSQEDLTLVRLLDLRDLEQTRKMALEVLSQCQAPECRIFSFGTTNTLIDSFLRHYLGAELDGTMLYAPIRGLRNANDEDPKWLERILPGAMDGVKRVLFVRTLAEGKSVSNLIPKIEKHLEERGLKWQPQAYFIGRPSRRSRLSENLKGVTWSMTYRELSFEHALSGSYRKIDESYYRYRYIDLYYPTALWAHPNPPPRIHELRAKLARSLGVASSAGPRFYVSPSLREIWQQRLAESTSLDDALMGMGFWLSYSILTSNDSLVTEFRRELVAINEWYFAREQFAFEDNPEHAKLDKMISLYINNPTQFAQLSCAAALINK